MKKRDVIGFAISAFVVLIVFFLGYTGILYQWERKFYDYKFAIRGEMDPPDDIVIIGVDDDSMKELGRWPWPRSIIAKGIENLAKAGAKVIGVDIIFPEESQDRSQDRILADSLKLSGNVIGALYFDNVAEMTAKMVDGNIEFVEEYNTRLIRPIDVLEESFNGMGFTNTNPDVDGVLRDALLVYDFEEKEYHSFASMIAAHYFSQKGNFNNTDIIKSDVILVNYRGPHEHYYDHSFKTIYSGKFPESWIRDKIVLVGSMAVATYDHYPTPYSNMFPGVEYHATIIDNLIHGDYIRQCPEIVVVILVLLFAFGLGRLFLNLKLWACTALFLVSLVSYFFLSQYIFTEYYYNINFFQPGFSMILSFLGIMSYRFVTESREKAWIKKTFSTYMSPDVIAELTTNPDKLKLGGERKNLSVLFSDIVGFTTMSEKLVPEEVSELLNEYLSTMTEVIFEYSGTLDKFIGDAIMAFWGAPVPQEDHPKRAVLCAVEMVDRLLVLREDWRKRGKPLIDIGIGIHTDDIAVGNFGSQQRMDYTVIGDGVNLASRIEGLTRQYKTRIIISQSTYEKVSEYVEVNPLGDVKVKGKEKPVTIYEVLKRKG